MGTKAFRKKAMANLLAEHVQLKEYGAADGSQKFRKAGAVVTAIETAVAEAYVSIQIEVDAALASESGKETCGVKVKGCSGAGDEVGCCNLTVESASESVSTDAIAEAGTPIS
jgi:hypothetical protein